MVHADIAFGLNGGFRVQRDAGARQPQHAQIVRPVAHGDHVGGRQAEPGRDFTQRGNLGIAPEDRARHLPGQLASLGQQRVGAVFVKAQIAGDLRGEGREPARDQRRISAMGLHRGDQGLAARHMGDAGGQHAGDDLLGQALQQAHTFNERAFEVEFAIHGARGDVLHPFAHPGLIGQFVDAFLLDHGAVHVGQKHPFAAAFCGLHHEVDALGLQALPHVPPVCGDLLQGKLCRDIGRKPLGIPAAPCIAKGIDQRGAQPPGGGIGQKRGDEHGRAPRGLRLARINHGGSRI